MNLNQVLLPARDIELSIDFYLRMGFELIVRAPHYARFKCTEGDATFSLHRESKAKSDPGIVIYFETANLDEVVRQLKAKGFAFDQEPRDEPWLWREARILDPSNNVICLYWAGRNRVDPPWRISERRS